MGGNSIGEFRTGPGGAEAAAELVAASQAMFVLTSDLELDPTDSMMGCDEEADRERAWESMLDKVKHQSTRFWGERQLAEPDWWQQLPLVPFRELCPDELTQVRSVGWGAYG